LKKPNRRKPNLKMLKRKQQRRKMYLFRLLSKEFNKEPKGLSLKNRKPGLL
jgi:hypothetical protein